MKDYKQNVVNALIEKAENGRQIIELKATALSVGVEHLTAEECREVLHAAAKACPHMRIENIVHSAYQDKYSMWETGALVDNSIVFDDRKSYIFNECCGKRQGHIINVYADNELDALLKANFKRINSAHDAAGKTLYMLYESKDPANTILCVKEEPSERIVNMKTLYAVENRSRELKLSDLRAEIENDAIGYENPIRRAEKIITDHLMNDDSPDMLWDIPTFDAAIKEAEPLGYSFCAYPSNNIIRISGTDIETYEVDDDGEYNQATDFYFPDLTADEYNTLLHELGLDEYIRRTWFAIQSDSDDDWGTGSFDFDEAVKMAKDYGYPQIAEIDGKYDYYGNATADPLCVKIYKAGEDF